MVGNGPPISSVTADTTDKHAILLFKDATISYVLPSYSAYLCELFSAPELRQGSFTAVGAVHRPSEDNNHLPRHVGNYWSDYDAELAASEPKPKTFCQYYMAGLKRANKQAGEAYPLVELIAEGVIALARRADPLVNVSNHQRKHRYLLQLLSAKHVASGLFGICDVVRRQSDHPISRRMERQMGRRREACCVGNYWLGY